MEPIVTGKNELYSSKQACAYLGMDFSLFRYHVYEKKHLKPDLRIGNNVVFRKSTLDEFKRVHQADGLTFNQAAAYLGMTPNQLRYHVFNTRLLVADGKKGKRSIYHRKTLDAFKTILPKREEEVLATE